MMNFDQVVQIAGILVNLIAGVGVIPLIGWARTQLKLGVRGTQVLVVVVAVVVSVLNMLVSGAITEEQLQPEYFVQLFIAILTASQAEYNRLRRQGQLK